MDEKSAQNKPYFAKAEFNRRIDGQDKQDVFEMILKSTEDGYAFNPQNACSDWHDQPQEGQLSIDVLNTDSEIIVVSTMAGADVEKIEVYIHNDLLTIRGVRPKLIDEFMGASYLYQECYWGKFSRTVVLPVDVNGDRARAEYKNGVLIIIIPKQKKDSRVFITIVED